MKNFLNGFGTCFSIITGLGFAFLFWWAQPQPIMSPQSNLKMDLMVLAYNGDEFDYNVVKKTEKSDMVLKIDMIDEIIK